MSALPGLYSLSLSLSLSLSIAWLAPELLLCIFVFFLLFYLIYDVIDMM